MERYINDELLNDEYEEKYVLNEDYDLDIDNDSDHDDVWDDVV